MSRFHRFLTTISLSLALTYAVFSHSALGDEQGVDNATEIAALSSFIHEVSKIERMANEVFRFQTLGILKLSHPELPSSSAKMNEDNVPTHGFSLRQAAGTAAYEFRKTRGAIFRNQFVTQEERAAADALIQDMKMMLEQAETMVAVIDTGHLEELGSLYMNDVLPLVLRIRDEANGISNGLILRIKLLAIQ
ncbi:MAG: hypothetical protein ABJ370_07295 [Paracoccaceae bacterium]